MLTFKNVNIISILYLTVFALLKIGFDISFWWILLIFVIWITLTIIGSFHIRWNYFLKAKHRNYKVEQNAVAITFDDGPNVDFTPRVLRLLKEYNAKATFFLIGKNVIQNPEITKQILSHGHTIGNHSFSHSNGYGFKSTKNVLEDIKRAQNVVWEITGLKLNFFRPPFGVANPNIASAVKSLNLETFGWSIRSYDTTSKSTEKIIRDMTLNIRNGDVLLMHDTSDRSIQILEQLLQFLEINNLKSITLEDLFNYQAYEY